MEKDQFIKSAARTVVAGIGMALIVAADEAANHEHCAQKKKQRIAAGAVLGSICQGVRELYYRSKKQ